MTPVWKDFSRDWLAVGLGAVAPQPVSSRSRRSSPSPPGGTGPRRRPRRWRADPRRRAVAPGPPWHGLQDQGDADHRAGLDGDRALRHCRNPACRQHPGPASGNGAGSSGRQVSGENAQGQKGVSGLRAPRRQRRFEAERDAARSIPTETRAASRAPVRETGSL